MTIDAHAHLCQSEDVASRILELRSRGFLASIQGGVGPEDWREQLRSAADHPDFFKPVLGLHPWWVMEHTRDECNSAIRELENLLRNSPEVVGLGELGLDFWRDRNRDESGLQQDFFQRQLELAAALDLPIVLHVVHAHEHVLQLLELQKDRGWKGLVHAFSGSFEIGQRYLKLGLKLSIGPGLAEPGRFKQLKSALPRWRESDWVLESDGAGPELMRAAQAASVIVGAPADELLKRSADVLRGVFGF